MNRTPDRKPLPRPQPRKPTPRCTLWGHSLWLMTQLRRGSGQVPRHRQWARATPPLTQTPRSAGKQADPQIQPKGFPYSLLLPQSVVWEFRVSSDSEEAVAGESYSCWNFSICAAHPQTSWGLAGGWEGQPENHVSHAYVGPGWLTHSGFSETVLSLKLKDPHSWANRESCPPWLGNSCS